MSEKQYISFALENEEYGINILKVNEINRLKEIKISKVPGTPYYIEGIINLRGDVVPIVNLRKKMGLKNKDIDKLTRIIVVKIGSKNIGLLVDSVSHVLTLEKEQLSQPPEEITIDSEYIINVAKISHRMIFIIDIERIVIGDEKRELSEVS